MPVSGEWADAFGCCLFAGLINAPDIFWMGEEVAEMGEGSKGKKP